MLFIQKIFRKKGEMIMSIAVSMSIEIKNEYGQIDISNDVIAQIAGGAAIECYGIVGMATKHQIRDGLTDILRKENFAKGVLVRQEDEDLVVDMYVIISYGTKISEVAYQVQSKVKYTITKTLGMSVKAVNIFVQGVRVTNP
jgi:uncharacterized alkaline shock family protein YloU